MRTRGRHFTYIDRLDIERQFLRGYSILEIAKNMNCSPSTIYRERAKGLYTKLDWEYREVQAYSADIAQQKHDYNATAKGAPLKLGGDFDLAQAITKLIKNKCFSPAVALATIEKQSGLKPFCVSTLYNYIDKGVFYDLTNKDLQEKTKRKKRTLKHKSTKLPKGETIEHRPDVINSRKTFGHWEMDTVHGKAKGKKQVLLVLTERKTNFEIIFKLADCKAQSVVDKIKYLHKTTAFTSLFKTITVDNGSEFQSHKEIEFLGTKMYYCHPYSSWERGANERQNRIIRRFLPKGKSLYKVTQLQSQKIADWINSYPRKIYNWKSSKELFIEELNNAHIPIPYFV